MQPDIISYYTMNTPYRDHAKKLANSLNALEIPFYIEGRLDRGDWRWNVAHKPTFILECLERFQKPMTFVDADAEVLKPPILLDELTNDYDVAVHYRQNGLCKGDLMSGTVWFNYTKEARDLVRIWKERTEMALEEYDQPQKILQISIESFPCVKVYELPSEYTRVFDQEDMGEAVIQHNQASRTNRKY